MLNLNIHNYPSQRFSFDVENNRYDLTIKDCDGFMTIDIACNNQIITQGQRLLPSTPIVSYPYLEHGNFILLTEKGQLPDWQQFGISQFLYFFPESELTEIRSQ